MGLGVGLGWDGGGERGFSLLLSCTERRVRVMWLGEKGERRNTKE